jgi:hypothetical protein
MPPYFYHVMDGHALVDTEWTELADLADARSRAINTAGKVLSEMDREFRGDHREWTMTVADSAGLVVFSLRFSADDHGVTETHPGAAA